MKSNLITIDKEIVSGTPVFTGTRVPIRTLMDYMTAGDSVDEFLDDFPGVSREQAVEFLREAEQALLNQFKQSALTQDDLSPFTSGVEYPIYTPFGNEAAAQILMEALEEANMEDAQSAQGK